jgi:predicted sugar kinase
MPIEITSPCCLHLGLARAEDGALSELGLTLQHPPIQLAARPAAQLSVVGPRADIAAAEAARLNLTGEIEIELAIPANMGLGSNAMMACAVHGSLDPKGLQDPSGLHAHAFVGGGLLLVRDDGLLKRRAAIAHAHEDDTWVFVLVLPKEPDDLTEAFEADWRSQLIGFARHLPHGMDAEVAVLFDAVERDDSNAFAVALSHIHAANEAALATSGHARALTDQDRDILGFMRANGAAFAARALTGLGLYGLVKGGPASRTLRKALTQHLGYFGPLVMASICDNHGAKTKMVS